MIYFIVLFLLLILTIRYDINGKTEYRDQWYNAVLVILILIAGLRFRLGEDTINYLYMFYYDFPVLLDLDIDTILSSGQPPLWILLNSIVKTLGGRFFVVQLIEAAILNVLMLKYFKKHSPYPFACTALYFFWRYQWYSMVVMKAAIALSVILYANDFFLEKKYLKGFLLVLIATGFHQSSILLVIIPFMTFLRFNLFGIILLVCSFFAGAILQSQLGDIFAMFEAAEGMSDKLDDYLNDDKYMGQIHNLNYFIVNIFPLIVYPILSIVYLKRNCKGSQVLRLEPFLMIALMFQMMQFNINIMYRYIYVFTPYYIIFIIHFFIEFSKNSLLLKKSLAFARNFIIILPLLVSIAFVWPMTHVDFYPYSSVFERSIDKDRELYYSGLVSHYYLKKSDY